MGLLIEENIQVIYLDNMAIKKRTKLSREDLIAKYDLQPEGLRQEVAEVVEKDKTNLDLYLADIGMIINSTQRLQKMDKKMRQVNLSLLEVEQYYNKQKARHSASFIGTSISEKPEDGEKGKKEFVCEDSFGVACPAGVDKDLWSRFQALKNGMLLTES